MDIRISALCDNNGIKNRWKQHVVYIMICFISEVRDNMIFEREAVKEVFLSFQKMINR